MKGMFPQFDVDSVKNYKDVWEQAIFVFDTNVLLNMYRYRAETRDQLLHVIASLSERVWIPYQVALEFQRNRLKVMAEQNSRFSDVRDIFDRLTSKLSGELNGLQLERRHSLIDTTTVVDEITTAKTKFILHLDEIQKNQHNLSISDPIKIKIEEIFDGKVGSPPENQGIIDELYKEAARRYQKEIPPGYMDEAKDKNGSDEYLHNGIYYSRKYGDYLLWRQILEYFRGKNVKYLVFITDDSKEDWWWVVKSGAPKVVGPRPELIDEARHCGNIENFLMYKPEAFLQYSKEHLAAEITPQALEEVKDVSNLRTEYIERAKGAVETETSYSPTIHNWLRQRFDSVRANSGFPDFIATKGMRSFGFELQVPNFARASSADIREIILRAQYRVRKSKLDLLAIVWVLPSVKLALEFSRSVRKTEVDGLSKRIRNIVGIIVEHEDGVHNFEMLSEFSLDDLSSEDDLFAN